MAMVIASIDADGWQAVYPSVPVGPEILAELVVSRAGFTAGGGATSFAETLTLTKRVRQPYPDQAVLTADKVALSDFVYASDSIAGVANNSALVSPKPVAKWASLDRDVVGNSITPELVAFHRDGVAYVEFRATDGVTTVTAGVSAAVVLGAATDQCAVVGYRAVLDIIGLTPGLVTVHAKVWPRLGAASSILDSAEKSARREFSARYYLKNSGLSAAPVYAYVSLTGDDATGAVSADAATAEAAPCATVGGALARINALHGPVDGAVIRVMAGTHTLASPTGTRTQNIAAVTVTRDPNAAKANVVLQWGAVNFNPRLSGSLGAAVDTGCLRFRDVTMMRTGVLAIMGDGGKRLEIQAQACVWNNANHSAHMFSLSDIWWVGVEYSGARASATQPTTQGAHMMWRGCSGDMGGANIDSYLLLGCDFTNPGRLSNGELRTGDGSVRAFNRFMFTSAAGSFVGCASLTTDIVGQVIAQNLFEGLPNSSFTLLLPSADSSTFNLTHLICVQNSITGFDAAGRSNILYDETPGVARHHTLHRVAGNIHVQLNTKHDVFMKDGARTGGWSYLYGVGCEGEFSQFRDAGSGSFAQEYAGAGASIGTSSSVRNDPLFVDYRGATAGAAGAGGGDYRLQARSRAIGVLPRELLAFDLLGGVRTRRVAGALEAALPPAAQLSPAGGVHVLESTPGALLPRLAIRPAGGRHGVADRGGGLGGGRASRALRDGRRLRVDEDSRTLWAKRD